jgi:teichuronic acid biosynthesis glycosyltransferase TuaC
MKILFICRGINFHGISPIMKRQGESLKKKGVDIEYFAINGNGIFGYIKNIIILRKFLQKKNYDLVHAHYGLCGFVTLLSKRKEKSVLSFMGSELINTHSANGKKNIQYYLLRSINKFCIRNFDFIVVKSKEMADFIDIKNKMVIPNGIDLSTFKSIEKSDARNILNLNLQQVIIIFIADPPDRPEKNIELAKLAIQKLHSKNVNFLHLHSLDESNLSLYYSAADLLLLTSLHEGSPNVIKEAMACGCPMVSTNVGDVEKNISGVKGCYISTYDPNDIAAKIEFAIEFALTNNRTNGRERIKELQLSSTTTADKIIAIYNKLILA